MCQLLNHRAQAVAHVLFTDRSEWKVGLGPPTQPLRMLHVSRCADATLVSVKGGKEELLSIMLSCKKQAKSGLTSGLGCLGLGAGCRLGEERLQGGQLLLREHPCNNVFQSLYCHVRARDSFTPASSSAVHLHTLT